MPDGTPAQSKKAGLGGIGSETIIIEYFRTVPTADTDKKQKQSFHSWSLRELPAKDLLREGSYTARAVFPHENLISDIVTFEVKGNEKVNVFFRLKAVEKSGGRPVCRRVAASSAVRPASRQAPPRGLLCPSPPPDPAHSLPSSTST
jgi:hypothetical protein